MTVATRDASGIVQLSGDQIDGFNILRIPFVFDTPGLLAGFPVFRPSPGDILIEAVFYVTESWDGTTPQANLFSDGDDPDTEQIVSLSPIDAGTPVSPGNHLFRASATGAGYAVAVDDTPIVLNVDDGAGGSPGAAQGAAELWLIVSFSP